MDYFDQQLYRESEKYFLDQIQKRANFLIITVPGLGASYLVKKFLEKNKLPEVKYIDTAGEALERFNFLDLNFDKLEDAAAVVDEYFRIAKLDQKFAVVVNQPGWVTSKQFKNSLLSSHIYGTYYFRARSREDVAIFSREMDSELSDTQVSEIFALSGGIGRLVKYLALNKEVLKNSEEITEDARVLLRPIAESILETSPELLDKLGLHEHGKLKSVWLNKYLVDLRKDSGFTISIGEDFLLEECGNKTGVQLSLLERQITEYSTTHNGVITKEKIADFKWGEGSYDKYSDQAIGKSMQRLNKKLKQHQFEVIPKVGYKLIKLSC